MNYGIIIILTRFLEISINKDTYFGYNDLFDDDCDTFKLRKSNTKNNLFIFYLKGI